jgi:hypothetical protein
MLTREVTPEMVASWKETFDRYRSQLSPDKKTGAEMIAYIRHRYPVTELSDETRIQVVTDNVALNECHARKLPKGKSPRARVFSIENAAGGKILYEDQDDIFRGIPIFVGIELETAFFLVEGSSRLWDELFVFRGLDNDDLANYYLVWEYISCLKKSGTLDLVLARQPRP